MTNSLNCWHSCAVSDGGEGFLDCLPWHTEEHFIPVHDADGSPFFSRALIYRGTAFLAVSEIIPYKSHPRLSLTSRTSQGIGEALVYLYQQGHHRIVLAAGGSGAHDGGEGCLEILGNHNLTDLDVTVLCDVHTSFAESIDLYAGQKGADSRLKIQLTHQFKKLAESFGPDKQHVPGGGVAGGLGLALHARLNATLKDGFNWLSSLLDLEEQIRGASLVVTGEGRLDHSTLQGKLVARLAELSAALNVPCHVICGSWDGVTRPLGATDIHVLECGPNPELTSQAIRSLLNSLG